MRLTPIFLALAGAVGVTGMAAERPNIVLFLCDDLRSDALGCMGHPFAQTPNIDRLSVRGVTFDEAFATTAICVTSRANLLSGCHAARTGWRHGVIGQEAFTAEEIGRTYLGLLKESGYRLGYAGKWHLGPVPEGLFDNDGTFEGQGNYFPDGPGGEHLTSRIASQAIEMVRAEDDRPFFIGVGFKAPHVQDGTEPPFYAYDEALTGHLYRDVTLERPPLSDETHFRAMPDFIRRSLNRQRWELRMGTEERYEESVRGYFRLVTGIDHAVGRVLASLEEEGHSRDTLVIFTSDHGVFLGARGLAGKWLPHEPSIRIPLIVYDPGVPVENRGRRAEMALTIDLAPTILEYAGVPVPGFMQGRSLAPLVRGESVEDWRSEFFYDHDYLPHEIPSTEAVRTERWKYIRYVNSDPLYEELYDLRSDPMEAHNLIGREDFGFVHEMMEEKWQKLRSEARGEGSP